MSITTYAELQTAVANWLNRTDLTSVIPDFITLAEKRISRDLNVRALFGRATTTTVGGTQYYALPSDLIHIVRLQMNTNPLVVLDYRSPDQLAVDYPYGTSGVPSSYTVAGNELQFGPIPDSTYTMEITYKKQVSALSGTNTTNWVLTNAPDVYLYASLVEATPYLAGDQRIQTWMSMYDRAVQSLNSSDKQYPGSMQVRVG